MIGFDLWAVVNGVFGGFSVAGVFALWEMFRTRQRLRKHVADYVHSVEFQWTNQSKEFVLMHKVRAFELLLRRVQRTQPRSPGANRFVEDVQRAVEFCHSGGVLVTKENEHLPLPSLAEFPIPPPLLSESMEAWVREGVLERLHKIKWLRLARGE